MRHATWLLAWVLWHALASDGELAYVAVGAFTDPVACRVMMRARNLLEVRPGGTTAGFLCLPDTIDPREE